MNGTHVNAKRTVPTQLLGCDKPRGHRRGHSSVRHSLNELGRTVDALLHAARALGSAAPSICVDALAA
eukprot:5382120-Pleurochrysis_carterae.AAC.1